MRLTDTQTRPRMSSVTVGYSPKNREIREEAIINNML